MDGRHLRSSFNHVFLLGMMVPMDQFSNQKCPLLPLLCCENSKGGANLVLWNVFAEISRLSKLQWFMVVLCSDLASNDDGARVTMRLKRSSPAASSREVRSVYKIN